ncbi:MAG TPA: PfaD family polyunsaturated fatty acid/polyketide biosynthesis protein [Bryobacteraceae bacterium]|nr:PfaD family polyunsaturated fatty acid/polyketide biosynthesis protein [Bryobacteraceae bacterium]
MDTKSSALPAFRGPSLAACITDIRKEYDLLEDEQNRQIGLSPEPVNGFRSVGRLGRLYPEWLGDRRFTHIHGCRFPYIVGEMARGVATPAMVVAAAKAGFLGFYGAAGLSLETISSGIREIERGVGTQPWGSNLIHTPNEPELERAIVGLYLDRNVVRVSASAFMSLTPQIVRYACHGIQAGPEGSVLRKNHVFAKISRPEVAAQFMRPAPANILDALVAAGSLTRTEAELAQRIPIAEDVTAEADSGGHTDNRPLSVLLPLILRERDRSGFPIRVGAAGGIGTPSSAASAFAQGAAYVLTGTVNQTAVESGLSESGRSMLAEAGMADVAMAPSADMFELGVKVQVLRKGSFYAQRAGRLYDLYRSYESLEELPGKVRAELESDFFGRPLGEIEADVRQFFSNRDPSQLVRAATDGRHLMALVFRWYLGHSSRWPIVGDASRRLDYQIWCGPAIGSFNEWVRDSFLSDYRTRSIQQIGLNIMEGAAIATRAHQARTHGVGVPSYLFNLPPRSLVSA